ncbi:MAG: hypothetical protein GXO33_03815 [Epsilonproteobacteria bacterium]|nr:hypothetical protein [Campylobacterota bacterium]
MLPSLATRRALKNALAFTLAFMIPLAQNWGTQAATAAVTVIVISTTALSPGHAFYKGLWRVAGTLLGAVVGMGLIALFPQDRFLYLAALSTALFVALFLARAYRGENTLFVLTVIMLLMVFKEGKSEGVFLYGAERFFMTLFAVIVYTAVWTLLWPEKEAGSPLPGEHRVAWRCREHWLGALSGILVFWAALFFWIYFNPPLGFMTVALATAMSTALLFAVATPAMMLVAFSLGLIVATLSYIFVLPQLQNGWQLGAFLFLYAFVSYRLLPPAMAMIVLIGTTTFHLQSSAFFHFGLFLNILFVLYAFLFLLLLFYYLPVSNRPEKRLLAVWRRLKRLAERPDTPPKALQDTLEALRLYAHRLNPKRFGIDPEAFKAWIQACADNPKASPPPPGLQALERGRF